MSEEMSARNVPGRHPLVDERLEPVVIPPPLGPDLGLLVVGKHVQRAEVHDQVVEVVQAGLDNVSGGRPQPLLGRARACGDLLQMRDLHREHLMVDLVQQVVLRPVVVVHRALGHACRVDDVLDRRALEAMAGEQARRDTSAAAL